MLQLRRATYFLRSDCATRANYAEGHAYRRAVQNAHRFVVVLGIWMIFGGTAAVGATLLISGRSVEALLGFFLVAISLAMIWKTTRSYNRRGSEISQYPDAA